MLKAICSLLFTLPAYSSILRPSATTSLIARLDDALTNVDLGMLIAIAFVYLSYFALLGDFFCARSCLLLFLS